MNPTAIFKGSDGDATRAMYAALEARGPAGELAVNLFRACKASTRAKVYRGGRRGHGSYRRMAYEKKNWSLVNLGTILNKHAAVLGVNFGWAEDPDVMFDGSPAWVFYVDLPGVGQVSFHSPDRYLNGPEYSGKWDGTHSSAERICEFCRRLLED
jgi:hypothetical protein